MLDVKTETQSQALSERKRTVIPESEWGSQTTKRTAIAESEWGKMPGQSFSKENCKSRIRMGQ